MVLPWAILLIIVLIEIGIRGFGDQFSTHAITFQKARLFGYVFIAAYVYLAWIASEVSEPLFYRYDRFSIWWTGMSNYRRYKVIDLLPAVPIFAAAMLIWNYLKLRKRYLLETPHLTEKYFLNEAIKDYLLSLILFFTGELIVTVLVFLSPNDQPLFLMVVSVLLLADLGLYSLYRVLVNVPQVRIREKDSTWTRNSAFRAQEWASIISARAKKSELEEAWEVEETLVDPFAELAITVIEILSQEYKNHEKNRKLVICIEANNDRERTVYVFFRDDLIKRMQVGNSYRLTGINLYQSMFLVVRSTKGTDLEPISTDETITTEPDQGEASA
jgi:hypothetical protein